MKLIAKAVNIQNGTYIIRLITVDQQHLKNKNGDLMAFRLICCVSDCVPMKADTKWWNKSPAEKSVFKKSLRLEGLLSNHLQMTLTGAQFSREGWKSCVMFLRGDIRSERNLVNLIIPSLEWLSRHRWTDPEAHPHLFPAQAPHLPAKYRSTDERC